MFRRGELAPKSVEVSGKDTPLTKKTYGAQGHLPFYFQVHVPGLTVMPNYKLTPADIKTEIQATETFEQLTFALKGVNEALATKIDLADIEEILSNTLYKIANMNLSRELRLSAIDDFNDPFELGLRDKLLELTESLFKVEEKMTNFSNYKEFIDALDETPLEGILSSDDSFINSKHLIDNLHLDFEYYDNKEKHIIFSSINEKIYQNLLKIREEELQKFKQANTFEELYEHIDNFYPENYANFFRNDIENYRNGHKFVYGHFQDVADKLLGKR